MEIRTDVMFGFPGETELDLREMIVILEEVEFDWFFFFSSRRRHTRFDCDWSSDVCSSDLVPGGVRRRPGLQEDRLPLSPLRGAASPGVREADRAPADAGRRRPRPHARRRAEIGRASCRERV